VRISLEALPARRVPREAALHYFFLAAFFAGFFFAAFFLVFVAICFLLSKEKETLHTHMKSILSKGVRQIIGTNFFAGLDTSRASSGS
jgi:hypothetical protein